jgi:hypothetical protein
MSLKMEITEWAQINKLNPESFMQEMINTFIAMNSIGMDAHNTNAVDITKVTSGFVYTIKVERVRS